MEHIVRSRLVNRLQRIEQLMRPADKHPGISVRFAHMHMLPPSYVGEKHEVLVTGYPSEDPANDCVIQELPGPGPELEFDFRKDTKQQTLLIRFVESDGNGHPKGYLPDSGQTGSHVGTTAQAFAGCAR